MKKLAIGMFVMFAGIKPADAAALEQLEAMGGAPASASMVFDGNAAREGTKEAVDPAPVQGLSGKSGAKAPEIEIERASPLKTGAANGINSTPAPKLSKHVPAPAAERPAADAAAPFFVGALSAGLAAGSLGLPVAAAILLVPLAMIAGGMLVSFAVLKLFGY